MPSAVWSADTLLPADWTACVPTPPLAANAPPAIVSEASVTATTLRRPRRRRRRRAASKRRARDRRLDSSHGAWDDRSVVGTTGNPLVSSAYGVSCRARAKTCATPHVRRFAPGADRDRLRWFPRSPQPGRRGLGKVGRLM